MNESSAAGFAESERTLHEEAVGAAGYDDFGDPSYLEGLRVLLDAYDREARFSELGRDMARATVVETLRKRLVAERAWRDQPELLDHEIERPIVICGLVRTGSTALHYLMGRDPELQALEYWLAANPEPRPPRDTWEGRAEFQASAQEIGFMYQTDPSLKSIHFMRADLPEECRHLLAQNFTDDGFEVNAHVPSYTKWYANVDMRPTYRRHKKLIQWIGSNEPGRPWLFKYPVHMRYLDAFLDVYPDACIVQTHRDPLSVMPSYISLITGFRKFYEDDFDKAAVARQELDLWAEGAERAIAFRKTRDPAQFYDLHFADFMADPIEAVKNIYTHFGRELSEPGERALRAWQEDNRQGKHGKHDYPKFDIGVSEQEILDRFAAYMDHHGMKPEQTPSSR
ncbi:MAG: sulfotransferase [bacterium]|nr:sulfotransferase [bacterium]